MPTIDFHESNQKMLREDPAFARACLREAVKCFDEGEQEIGVLMLDDLLKAGISADDLLERPHRKRKGFKLSTGRKPSEEFVEA